MNTMNTMITNPRSTRTYARARELIRLMRKLSEHLDGFADLRDQGRRAACATLLLFAEGCGRRTLKDRRRFFDMAKGSAYEVVAVADAAYDLGLVDEQLQERIADIGDKLGGLLYRVR